MLKVSQYFHYWKKNENKQGWTRKVHNFEIRYEQVVHLYKNVTILTTCN
jgi:hypothetical protein